MLRISTIAAIAILGTISPVFGQKPAKEQYNKSKSPVKSEPLTKEELKLPRFDPKPVIWQEDWSKKKPQLPPGRVEAKRAAEVADHLKQDKEFDKAEHAYLEAIKADPKWPYPYYQLACNYELSNRHPQAEEQFAKAVELGFDDFPAAVDDDELGKIRNRPDFNDSLRKIRARYIVSSKEQVGQPIAVHPKGTKPTNGWPMMLMLHGYGDNNISYLPLAKPWADQGFLTVVVPGSVPMGDGRLRWATESLDPAQDELQTIINSKLFDGSIDKKRIYLLGFSQGALQALLLTTKHSDQYAGAVALSPGGPPPLIMGVIKPVISRDQRPARIVFIHGNQERHDFLVPIWSTACERAGWKFMSKVHNGGHHFPENWAELQPEVAAFLRETNK